MKSKLLLASIALSLTGTLSAERILHFPMEADKYGELSESVTNGYLQVYGHHINENIDGAVGKALRFDGYSTYAQGNIKSIGDRELLTVSLWVAPETYPIVKIDTPTDEKIRLAGNLDETKASGWEFCLGYTGKYSFKTFSGGWPIEIEAEDILPRCEWSHLVAVYDALSKKLTLYRNGEAVATGKVAGNMNVEGAAMSVGKRPGAITGDFSIETFNGLIDEIEVFDSAMTQEEIAQIKAENPADLSIPASRFEGDLLRPKFHGMPAAGWTNETHGMTFSNGRYHVFFQKNANGPYMTRLHWGHISSDNLYDWREEPIAIAPAENYDIKGCWSGCVFTDDEITGGSPNAIYTAVDYQKAMIAQAAPTDEDLINWVKADDNPIINGKPMGLSDDFRDPYFFRNGDDAYIIVGTSRDNIGAATLHKYDPASGRWSNDGKIFFQGTSKATDGRFWEMPTVTRMENGKWLVTVTPLETATGVHTLYWTGDINADGTFAPDSNSGTPRDFELISKEGYGLLSPTIYQKDGKTIVLGIVPDKVATSENCKWGWAHLYSFPREITLDSQGNLLQRPFDGLRDLRSADASATLADASIDGILPLGDISGRQVELYGKFIVGAASFGFNLLKSASGEGKVYYNPATNEIIADFSGLNRLSNDNGVYNGIYRAVLPERPAEGTEMTLDIFLDGSIVDIFVNDKWATSIRVYPLDSEAGDVEVFSQGGTVTAPFVGAWTLTSEGSNAVGPIWNDCAQTQNMGIYTLSGLKMPSSRPEALSNADLTKGLYIINGKKKILK